MADSDLTQSNDTAVFPATADFNTNADPFLIPTDGKKITASSNAPNQAPVNRAIKRLHALVAGLRGALLGDFAGADQRTIRSLLVDGIGGISHALAAGMLKAKSNTAIITAENAAGTLYAATGPGGMDVVDSAGGTFNLRNIYLRWINTAAGGSNPAKTAAAANFLYPLNVPKYLITFSTDGAGAITYEDGFGGPTLTIAGGKVVVTFPSNFDNIYYQVMGSVGTAGAWAAFHADPADKAVGSCKVKVGALDPAAVAVYGQIIICGRQTT